MSANAKFIFFSTLVASLGLSAHSNAAVHALLIGVSDYQNSEGVSNLLGPPNDIALMKQVLSGEHFKIPPANISVILNPTHTAIEKAFAELAARVQPNDQVYIHYSGHGSWAVAPPAAPGEDAERRGQDQTWVGHGSRSKRQRGNDALDVLDKEIALWLDPLYKLTPDVVVVSDSCHSASVTRDVQVGVRATDGANEPHPLRATIKRVPRPTTGLRIGAARDFESAVEFDPRGVARCIDAKECYGVFTWHWASALNASRPGESWGDVFNRATANITATPSVNQRPQMEGVANRAVFAGQFAPLSALVPVTEVRTEGTVTLGAGRLSGVTVGSEFEGTASKAGVAPRLRVTETTAGTAQGKLLGGNIKAGEVVHEVKHQYDAQPIRLYVGGPQVADVDAALARQVRQSIESARNYALEGFDLVQKRDQADWRLEILRPKSGTKAVTATLPEGVQCTSAPCSPPELWVVSPKGQLMDEKMRFDMARPDEEMPRLLGNLASFAHVREVRRLGAQGNDSPLKVQVSVLRPPHGNTDKCTVGVKPDSGWQRSAPIPMSNLSSQAVQLGDCLAFTLINSDTAKPWYGYVLGLGPKYNVQPIWPTGGANADEARIEPNTTYSIANSFYRLSDPGHETLLFVAAEIPAPITNLTQPKMRSAAIHGRDSELVRLLNASVLTRGNTESEVSKWGAQSLDLDVVDRKP